jgi:RimJ/RimL family protein N-acetyltransferase
MQIRILEPDDSAALEAFLAPRLESSMFLIGNLRVAGLRDQGAPYEGTYAAAYEQGQMVAVVAHYWNRNLVLQAPVHVGPLCKAAAVASGRPVRGLVGPAPQVERAMAALDIVAASAQLDERETLFALPLADLCVPEPLANGRVCGRRAGPDDVELVTEWRVAFSLESLGDEDSPRLWEQVRTSVRRGVSENRIWVLEAAGVPVSTSGFNAAVREAVQIGGVWTPPAQRGRGYGRAVVAASLLDARNQGVGKAVLFTGLDNLPARRAYGVLGFRPLGDYRLVLLRHRA